MYYELKKSIKKPHIIFLALFFIIWGLIVPSFLTVEYWYIHLKLGYEKKSDVVYRIEELGLNGMQDMQKKVKIEQEEYNYLIKSEIPSFLVEFFYESASNKISVTNAAQSYYTYGTSSMHIRKLIDSGKPRSLRKVQEIVEKNQNNIYKKQLEMLKSVGKPQAQYTTFIQYYETFTSISMIVVVTFLLLIFSNTGSQEYTSKMNLLLYSSPISKRKIFINKMVLIIIIGSVILFLMDLCHFVIFFVAGYGGNLDIKLNSISLDFVYCPYNISVFYYWILKFIVQQITIMVVAAALVFISMRWKSSIITIAVVGISTIGGYSLALMELNRTVLVRYSLGVGMSPSFIFKDYYALGIGDVVILYPIIYIVWLFVLFFVCVWRLFALEQGKKSGL